MDTKSKYKRLISCSQSVDGNSNMNPYKDHLFLWEEVKGVIASNGHILMVDRTLYQEMKVMSRLQNNVKSFTFSDGEETLTPSKTLLPSLSSFNLNMPGYTEIGSVAIPEWPKFITKEASRPAVTLMQLSTGRKIWAITEHGETGISCDARYLAQFADMGVVDLHMPKTHKEPIYVLPEGGNIDHCEWFALIMPIRVPATKEQK